MISPEELKLTLDINEKENAQIWKEIISDIDSNGDGLISFLEFKSMMYNLISSA